MPTPTGVSKQLLTAVETTYGVAPAAGSGRFLPRVTSSLDLAKDPLQSARIRTTQQVADMRHGVRRVSGTISDELSPGTFAEWFGILLRRDFTSVSAITAVSLTIASGAVVGGLQTWTVTRAAGSFLTDGVKVGDAIQLSVGALNALNLGKNLWVIALTATAATVVVLNGSQLFAQGPVTGCTVTVVGKKTFAPQSGHTDKSVTIEHWFPETPSSELFTGCKFTQAQIRLDPSSIASVEFSVDGQNVTTASTRYFTTPTAASTTPVVAAVNGYLMLNGTPLAIVTQMDLSISGAFSGDPVVGRVVVPNRFPGRLTASGSFSAYFDDVTLRDAFVNETELSLGIVMTGDNTASAPFISFMLPRIKLTSLGKNDGEIGIVQSIGFMALENTAGGAGIASEASTIVIQDSAA